MAENEWELTIEHFTMYHIYGESCYKPTRQLLEADLRVFVGKNSYAPGPT